MHFKIKNIKGGKYLYLIKNARVNGKVTQVKQICVGTPDKVQALLSGEPKVSLKSFEFGRTAALLHAADRLGLIEIIDEVVDKKKMRGLSVGEFILTLIAARVDGTLSRAGTEDWFENSILKFFMDPKYSLSSQNCLNQINRLDEIAISRIELGLAKNLIKLGIKPSRLIFDTTNQYTYILKGEKIPRKGYSKAKRNDKNLVGIGLAINDFNLPFMSNTYPGNESDSVVFARMTEQMKTRIKELGIEKDKMTLIFDRGNNSEENFLALCSDMNLLGAIPRSLAMEFLDVPLSKFDLQFSTPKERIIKAYETKGRIYEQEFRIVVQFSKESRERQLKKFEEDKKKILEGLEKIRTSCLRVGKGRKPSQKGIINKIGDLIPKDLRSVFEYGIDQVNEKPVLWFKLNPEHEEKQRACFGKTAIFTNNPALSAEEIVVGYNSKWKIEEDFKWLNDKFILPFCPFFVRKDVPIRAHVFLCVIGLMLYRFLQHELDQQGSSLPALVSMLESIRIAVVKNENGASKFVIENLGKDEAVIFSKLELGKFIPQ